MNSISEDICDALFVAGIQAVLPPNCGQPGHITVAQVFERQAEIAGEEINYALDSTLAIGWLGEQS